MKFRPEGAALISEVVTGKIDVRDIAPDPYLEARARRSTGKAFAEALAQVPDAPPEEYDRLEK